MMTDQPTRLLIENVSHWFGPNRVLHSLTIKVKAGQIVSLVGPSGCGKSTLLRAIVGTHPPKEGRILCCYANGKTRHCTRPSRDIGIVYQQYSLYPFLTAQKNVAFGLIMDQTSVPGRLNKFAYWPQKKKFMEQAAELLHKVGLGEHIYKYPSQLSGGQRQRVAVAQALIMKPRVLLLDEPFGALDESMREDLQEMLLHLYQENCEAKKANLEPPHTIVIVTHELKEALYVGDRILGLSQYWDWQPKHNSCPGATIVYDKPAPVFHPDDPKDFASFAHQKEEIKRVISQPRNVPDKLLA